MLGIRCSVERLELNVSDSFVIVFGRTCVLLEFQWQP